MWKDPKKKCYNLPYLSTDDAIMAVLDCWPAEWYTASDLKTRSSKSAAKRKKEEARLKME